MGGDGHKTALEEAVAAARAEEAARGPDQSDLFLLDENLVPVLPAPPPVELGANGSKRGRPPGARNLRTDQASRWYMARHGDPLERGIAISALPVLAAGVLEGLAARLGCSRHDAAKFWVSVYTATLPFIHQRLASLEVKQQGSLGSGDPVMWTFSDDGELVDVTPNAQERFDHNEFDQDGTGPEDS